MVWEIILIGVTLLFLVVASYTDLRWREVPDWLNFGLIFSALGLRLIFSLAGNWGILLNGLLGFIVCVGLAYLFYWANWWGGGDSKLLMGMGAVIGLGFDFESLKLFSLSTFDFSLLWFFLGLLLFGAVLGLLWSGYLALSRRKYFGKDFRGFLRETKKLHYLVLVASAVFLVLSFFQSYLWPMVLLPMGGFYTFHFVKAVEKSCFTKKVSVDRLVEGDWLAKDIIVDGKKLVSRERGLEREEIWKLRHLWSDGKLKAVWVKEGIPFVPSFLVAYLFLVFGKELIKFILGIFA